VTVWIEQPADPARTILSWGWEYHTLAVWEEPDDVDPWILSWQVDNPRDFGNPLFRHQERFHSVWEALARAAVITASVELDERLVQSDLNVPSDRRAFDTLATRFIAFTTARRESTALLHHTKAGR
jgi:hypothetical protein